MNFFIEKLGFLIFYPIFNIPLLVLLVISASLFLLVKLKFINFLGFFDNKNIKSHKAKKDEISSFAAFMSAAGATLGMGNIIGGAIAIKIAGPGSLFWIAIFSLFLSIIKFSETALGYKYRIEDKQKIISGGAFFYIKNGFSDINFPKIGLIFSFLYAIFFIIAYVFAGSFQLNQISSLFSIEILHMQNANFTVAIFIGTLSLLILLGGIHRIGKISSAIVPFMVLCHILCSGIIIYLHIHNFNDTLKSIFYNAFNINSSKYGGLMFVIIYSLQRILFGSDSGTGAAAIANSNSNKGAIGQAMIVSLEPILVAIMMIISGFVVMLTGGHLNGLDNHGIHVISLAFSNGGTIILYLFWINITLFGLTSIVSDGYYVEKAWYYISKGRYIIHSKFIYIGICIACTALPFKTIMPLSDITFNLSIMLNTIAIVCLSGVLAKFIKNNAKKYN